MYEDEKEFFRLKILTMDEVIKQWDDPNRENPKGITKEEAVRAKEDYLRSLESIQTD